MNNPTPDDRLIRRMIAWLTSPTLEEREAAGGLLQDLRAALTPTPTPSPEKPEGEGWREKCEIRRETPDTEAQARAALAKAPKPPDVNP